MNPVTASVFERMPPLRALRHSGFRLLTLSTAPHLLAMQMSTVALGYLAYALSGSATALGFIGLGWGIPMLVLSLVGGVVADRFPRKLILMGTQTLVGLSALLGAVLLFTNVIQIWHIFIIALMQGTAFAFNMPARQALIGELVHPDEIGAAVALNNTLMNASRVVGPPIAGFLIGAPTVGINGVYVLMAGAYLVVLALLVRLPRTTGPGRPSSGGWRSLKDGLRFIWNSPPLIVLLVLAFVPMFLGMPYQMLLPVFAVGILQSGPEGLGLLNAANGIGAVVGSVVVAFLASGSGQRRAQMALGILFGLSLAAFALSTSLWLASLTIAVVGIASAGFMSINNALIMSVTPREYHGRVMSVYMMTWSLMPIVSLPAAWLADIFSAPRTVAVMGGVLAVAIAGVALWQRRAQPAVMPATAPGD